MQALMQNIHTLVTACSEVTDSKLLLLILKIALEAGNFLNSGATQVSLCSKSCTMQVSDHPTTSCCCSFLKSHWRLETSLGNPNLGCHSGEAAFSPGLCVHQIDTSTTTTTTTNIMIMIMTIEY